MINSIENWEAMTPEEKNKMIKNMIDGEYERQYNAARALYPDVQVPDWCDLTEERREEVRDECRSYQREMDEFGKYLAKKFNG